MRPFGDKAGRTSNSSSGPSPDDALVVSEARHGDSLAAYSDGATNGPTDDNVTNTAAHDAAKRQPALGVAKLIFGTNVERIHIDTCRASNEKADRLRGLVVVFIGGTGGIGESTARELFRRSTAPKAYIVGRNKDKGTRLVEKLSKLNPSGTVTFIKKDCALLSNVDEVCADIRSREHKINCLFLTAGYMTLKGRNETTEGLDRKMAVNYYSRMRYIFNLMPLLTAAAEADELSRVITVLAAGSEGDVRLDDLDLRHNFALHACLAHCVLMSDFMMEELAKRYKGTSFSHSYPGTVKTGIANELAGPARLAVKVLYAVMSPWILNVQESGERHFFQITSKCYPPAQRGTGIEIPEGLSTMRGSNGETGSGAYLLDWDGQSTGDERILKKYREQDFGRIAWDHTMQMFEQAEQRQKSTGEKRSMSDTPEGSDRSGSAPVGWRAG
ncbi:hypothetical protein AMS68_007121 [Peltaster fructicola]|uniref:Ketoreductase (KR) domain-containing protein n=1 Tax=Peltaster fructicola TaxID=286661 RepID=A0A6H0Y3L1_9PEZI|nr:hypothetical protein AMS68_007121 [Peltaster fructicola]